MTITSKKHFLNFSPQLNEACNTVVLITYVLYSCALTFVVFILRIYILSSQFDSTSVFQPWRNLARVGNIRRKKKKMLTVFIMANFVQQFSGHKRESTVWQYLEEQANIRKSKCLVPDAKGRICGHWSLSCRKECY